MPRNGGRVKASARKQPIVIFRYVRHADGAPFMAGVPHRVTPRMAGMVLRGPGMVLRGYGMVLRGSGMD